MRDKTVFHTELEHAAWDDDAQRWRCRTSSGEVSARTLVAGSRQPVRAAAARDRGSRHLRRRRSSTPRAGTTRSTSPGQAGRGDRHRRLGDPDRARAAAGGRPPRRLPAHRPVGDPAQRPPLPAGPNGPPCGASRRSAGSTGPASTGRTRATCRCSPGSRGSALPAEKAALANLHHGDQGPRAPGQGDADLPARLQADPALQHLLPRARGRERRRRHRPDHPRDRRPRSSPPTGSSTPST